MPQLKRDVFRWNLRSECICANTGEKSLERISMRPSGLSLVLPQNPAAAMASIQKHPAPDEILRDSARFRGVKASAKSS
jgi:hypothetical protein